MAGGSAEPETPSDVACEHCGRYWAKQGLALHEQHCDGNADESESGAEPSQGGAVEQQEEQPPKEPSTQETAQEPQVEVQQDEPAALSSLVCPNCENVDNGEEPKFYRCNKNLHQFFQNHGDYDPDVAQSIHESDIWCSHCGAFLQT